MEVFVVNRCARYSPSAFIACADIGSCSSLQFVVRLADVDDCAVGLTNLGCYEECLVGNLYHIGLHSAVAILNNPLELERTTLETLYSSPCFVNVLDVLILGVIVDVSNGDVGLRRVSTYPSTLRARRGFDALGFKYSLFVTTDDERVAHIEGSLYVVVGDGDVLRVAALATFNSPGEGCAASRDVVCRNDIGRQYCGGIVASAEGNAIGIGSPVASRAGVILLVVYCAELDSAVARGGEVVFVELSHYIVVGNRHGSLVVTIGLVVAVDSPCKCYRIVEVDIGNLNGSRFLLAVHEVSLAGGGPLALHAVERSVGCEVNNGGRRVAAYEVVHRERCLARLLVDDVLGGNIHIHVANLTVALVCTILYSPGDVVVAGLEVGYRGGGIVVRIAVIVGVCECEHIATLPSAGVAIECGGQSASELTLVATCSLCCTDGGLVVVVGHSSSPSVGARGQYGGPYSPSEVELRSLGEAGEFHRGSLDGVGIGAFKLAVGIELAPSAFLNVGLIDLAIESNLVVASGVSLDGLGQYRLAVDECNLVGYDTLLATFESRYALYHPCEGSLVLLESDDRRAAVRIINSNFAVCVLPVAFAVAIDSLGRELTIDATYIVNLVIASVCVGVDVEETVVDNHFVRM